MDSWSGFYGRLERLDAGERRAAAERAAFELWSAGAEEHVFSALVEAATARARELEGRAGLRIGVTRSEARSEPADGARRRVLTLELGMARAYLYSTRPPGLSPSVHIGVLHGRSSTRFPVMAAVPGCLVVRGEKDAIDLVGPPAADGSPRARVTVDTLVLRTFGFLVGAHEAARRSAPT